MSLTNLLTLFSSSPNTNESGAPEAHTVSTMLLSTISALLMQTVKYCDTKNFDLAPASDAYLNKKDKWLTELVKVYRHTYAQDCERFLT